MKPEQFKAEVLPLRDKLFFIARRMLEEEQDAEDAVQETFLKLWNMRDTLDRYESVAALATTVTKNLCIDKLRTRDRQVSVDDELNRRAGTDNPYLQLERKNTEDVLKAIIERLPALQQAIIKMKDVEEYELDEIASITGTSVEAVRVNLSRARKRVRETYIQLTTN
ncbi:MAG: sigma-70 family RNA polymerase sigma factor [Bacteroidota bacterium]|nr:sigma-70 family RNA polymerase sigma factor [Bacteroidota bacterium]